MGLLDGAKAKLSGVREGVPPELRDKAHEAATSAKAAGRDVAALAGTAATIAGQAASAGAGAFSDARDDGRGLTEAARKAGREALDTATAPPS